MSDETEPQVLVDAPESVVDLANQIIEISHSQAPTLYKRDSEDESLLTVLLKTPEPENTEATSSGQGVSTGRKSHPYDRRAIISFLDSNEHHAACISAKVQSTIGLGYKDSRKETKNDDGTVDVEDVESKVDKALDPLCRVSWADTIWDVAEDFWQVGDGYIEVVRKGNNGKDITGLHHLPCTDAHLVVEDDLYHYHWEITSTDKGSSTNRIFAAFGDRDGLISRMKDKLSNQDADAVSEVIQIRRPTSKNRWYGYCDWLSAVAAIELIQCLKQYKYDFFLNRGVPEFMLFILGQKLGKEDWAKVENAMRANIGLGRSHKSLALNLTSKEITVQVEKLAVEGKQDDDFSKTGENLASSIVSAHGVPPLLAGIMVPGKLGASNELVNALQAFQLLKIGPVQRIFKQALGSTLGNPKMNGSLGLKPEDFAMRKITDEIDLAMMDTVSRQRTEATAKDGRDPKDGLRD